jgi:hypothetical protein
MIRPYHWHSILVVSHNAQILPIFQLDQWRTSDDTSLVAQGFHAVVVRVVSLRDLPTHTGKLETAELCQIMLAELRVVHFRVSEVACTAIKIRARSLRDDCRSLISRGISVPPHLLLA